METGKGGKEEVDKVERGGGNKEGEGRRLCAGVERRETGCLGS